MYLFDSKTNNTLYNPEFIDKVLKNRYKDTPYSIIKDGRMWSVYIRLDINNEECICGYQSYYSKSDAIKDIEDNKIFENIKKEYETLKTIYKYLKDY